MLIKPIFKVITETTEADTDKYDYYQVYSGSDSVVDININGQLVSIQPGALIDIYVNEIDSVADIYVLGVKKPITPTII